MVMKSTFSLMSLGRNLLPRTTSNRNLRFTYYTYYKYIQGNSYEKYIFFKVFGQESIAMDHIAQKPARCRKKQSFYNFIWEYIYC